MRFTHFGAVLIVFLLAQPAHPAPSATGASNVDSRAARLVDAMTLEEQISLLRPLAATTYAALPADKRPTLPTGALGSAGFLPAIPRVGWPALQESDGPLGVANIANQIRPGDEATALPSSLAWAASFDPGIAMTAGRVIGAEAHAKGFNVMLAGGLNLARDPRNGRNFEYAGEDPLLAGLIVGAAVQGIQNQHVVSTVKHFAFNDQETGRGVVDVRIDPAAARESDLLAFQVAIDRGHPGAVMCSYNRVNGEHSCENAFLLNRVLKGDWGYPGWVMSDWGGVHSLRQAVDSGLDQESPQDNPYFAGLSEAVAKGEVSRARVHDMAYRIVRSVIAAGVLDDPARPGGRIDSSAHAATAQAAEEAGAVLLKNDGLLPLGGSAKRILLVGGHADQWVVAGGGGSQVNPYGGGIQHERGISGLTALWSPGYGPSSPLAALRKLRPGWVIQYDDGRDPARAASAARQADAVIVFATKHSSEAVDDSADLALPEGQDALISAISAANPNTGVVLETGNPVGMPWLGSVKSVLEAWFPGQRGGEAIAALLTGAVSPSGRLPITFPSSIAQLPRPTLDHFDARRSIFVPGPPPFAIECKEGSDVGYRWYERTHAQPLFPFGFGLTYTSFSYSGLKIVDAAGSLSVSLVVRNTGRRAGIETPQLYVAPPGRTHRLAGWARVALKPGEARRVVIQADPRLLASYEAGQWRRAPGRYDVRVSPSAADGGLQTQVAIPASR